MKLIERIFDGLVSSPLNTVGALIIFLLALPLIRKGLRDRPPAPPASVPIQIESPWLVQNITQMQMDIERIKEQHGLLSSQIAGIAKLLRRREPRKPKS